MVKEGLEGKIEGLAAPERLNFGDTAKALKAMQECIT